MKKLGMMVAVAVGLFTQNASALELGQCNSTVLRNTGNTFSLDGSHCQVFNTAEALPLTLSRFEIDVKAGWTLQWATGITTRLSIYTNSVALTNDTPWRRYVVNTDGGLTWTPLTASTFVGRSGLPPEILPVTTNLIFKVVVTGMTGIEALEEIVWYADGRIDGGMWDRDTQGNWRPSMGKFALRVYATPIQPTNQVALKIERRIDARFGGFLHLSWPRGMSNVNWEAKTFQPTGTVWDNWYGLPGVYGENDLWWYDVYLKNSPFPSSGVMIRLVK